MFRYLPFDRNFTATYTVTTKLGGITIVDTGNAGTVELTEEQAKAGYTITTTVTIAAGGYWQISFYGNTAGETVTISNIVITPIA